MYFLPLLLLFSHWVMSDSLWPHWLQHTRLLCPSSSPGECSNSCPLSQWCHPSISSSVIFLLPSIFPSIRVFSSESALLMGWPKYQSFSWTFFYRNQLISSFTLKCSDEIRECLYFCGECVLDLPCVKWTEVKWRALRQCKAVWKPCSHPGMREMGGNSNHCGPPSQAGHSNHTGETPPGKRRVGRSRIWAINHRIEEYQG